MINRTALAVALALTFVGADAAQEAALQLEPARTRRLTIFERLDRLPERFQRGLLAAGDCIGLEGLGAPLGRLHGVGTVPHRALWV